MEEQDKQIHLLWMEHYETNQRKEGRKPSKAWIAAKQTIGHLTFDKDVFKD